MLYSIVVLYMFIIGMIVHDIICTGLNIVFSGLASKLNVAKTAYSNLIPAFVETLTKAPMLYPQPPNITQYTGIYTATWGTGSISLANVHLNGGSLSLSGTALWGIYLAYREPFKFQVSAEYAVIKKL